MRFILDSIAENQRGERIATFECGEKMISINENDMPNGFVDTLFNGAIIEAELVNGKLVDPVILEKESQDKMAEMHSRLNRLRNRNKK